MTASTVIGMHICGSVVRRACLRRSGRRIEIVRLDEQPLGVSGGPSPEASHLNSARIVASLPGSDVISRCWQFPDADDTKVKQMIFHKLEADMPIPVDKLVWGYRKLSGSSKHGRDVFVQAARAEQVERHIAALSSGGVSVAALTTAAEGLGGLYRYGLKPARRSGTEVLVLADNEEWLVGVLVDGMVRSVRRVHVKPDQIELACRECRQSIEAAVPITEVRHVLWSAAASLAGAREQLAKTLGLVVTTAEPHDRITGTTGSAIDPDRFASFGPAIGLALAGIFEDDQMICLAGHDVAEDASAQRWTRRLVLHPWRWTAVAAAILILAAAIHVGAIRSETKQMQAFLKQAEESTPAISRGDPRVQAMLRLKEYRIEVEAIIADVCKPIPNDIVISSIDFSRGQRIVIKGKAKDPKAVPKLADALKKKDHRFANVFYPRAEIKKDGPFTISADLVEIKKLSSRGRGVTWK